MDFNVSKAPVVTTPPSQAAGQATPSGSQVIAGPSRSARATTPPGLPGGRKSSDMEMTSVRRLSLGNLPSTTQDTEAVRTSQDVAVRGSARTLEDFQARLNIKPRIDCDVIAEQANTYRYNPFTPDADHLREGHSRPKVDGGALERDYIAKGGTQAGWHATKVWSGRAGALVPLGSSVTNLLVYGIVPFATMNAKSPWVSPAISLFLAVFQPLLTSLLQPYVVQFQERTRQELAPSVRRDKGVLNSARTIRELSLAIDRKRTELDASGANIARQIEAWMKQYDVAAPQAADNDAMVAVMKQLFDKLDENGRNAMLQMCSDHTNLHAELGNLAIQVDATGDLYKREKDVRLDQRYARVPRGASGFAGPFVRQLPKKASYLDRIKTHSRWSASQVTGLSVGIGVMAILGQMAAAGSDERRHALPSDARMNLLYGDVFNEKGAADWAAGRPITADGIDAEKAAALRDEPEMAMVRRITTMLSTKRKKLLLRIEGIEARLGDAHPAIEDPAHVEATGKLAQFDHDLAELGAKRVTNLTPGGDALRLMNSAMSDFALKFAIEDGTTKLGSDFKYQIAERVAQSFLAGAFGSVATIALGRLVLAARGGSKEAGLTLQLILQCVTLLISTLSAIFVHTTSNTKAWARENAVGFMSQMGWGIVAPFIEVFVNPGAMQRSKQMVSDSMANHHRDASSAVEMLKRDGRLALEEAPGDDDRMEEAGSTTAGGQLGGAATAAAPENLAVGERRVRNDEEITVAEEQPGVPGKSTAGRNPTTEGPQAEGKRKAD